MPRYDPSKNEPHSVRAHLAGNPSRPVAEGLGNVRVVATLRDGTKLWSGIEILRAESPDIPCALADGIADQLREAIRRVRATSRR